MRRLYLAPLIAFAISCSDTPLAPEPDAGSLRFSEQEAAYGGGAWIFNRGAGQPGPTGPGCHYGAHRTDQITVVHTPSGEFIAKCHFEGLPSITRPQNHKNWLCSWWISGVLHYTRDSHWTRSPSGQGTVTCRFETEFPPPPKS